jgi:HK97 family phage prohead protease
MERYFYGYASIFKVKDLNNDIILAESFDEEDLNPNKIPFLYEHYPEYKIGSISKILQNNKGLYVEGKIEKEFIQSSVFGLSIGYIPIFKMKAYNGIRYISKLKLFEISMVKNPANKKAIAFCI